MTRKVLATKFYYLDDQANSILCDVVYFDGSQVQHKIIEDTRYSDAIAEDIKSGYQCEVGLMTVKQPQEFIANFKKKYFGSYFYAATAETINLDDLK